jgi:hypothetical protein
MTCPLYVYKLSHNDATQITKTCSVQTSRPVLCQQGKRLWIAAERWGNYQYASSMTSVMEVQYSCYEITLYTSSQATKRPVSPLWIQWTHPSVPLHPKKENNVFKSNGNGTAWARPAEWLILQSYKGMQFCGVKIIFWAFLLLFHVIH